jgi:putative transposase
VRAHQGTHRVATVCLVLGVSTSGYYAWQSRPRFARDQADQALLAQIRTIHDRSRGTYGAPRIHAELAAEGVHIGRKRVARLM